MSGIMIYPSRVKEKTRAMDRELARLNENVESEKTAMKQVVDETNSLSGLAWDSARNYLQQIQLPLLDLTQVWIDAQMEGNRKYHQAAEAMPQVKCLDQDLLERELDYWESQLDREYDRDNPRRSRIKLCRNMISAINSKLRDIDYFVSKTNGIYDRAMEIQLILDRADTEIGKVSYDPTAKIIHFASVDRGWALESARLKAVKQMKAMGLTDLQIEKLFQIFRLLKNGASVYPWGEIEALAKKASLNAEENAFLFDVLMQIRLETPLKQWVYYGDFVKVLAKENKLVLLEELRSEWRDQSLWYERLYDGYYIFGMQVTTADRILLADRLNKIVEFEGLSAETRVGKIVRRILKYCEDQDLSYTGVAMSKEIGAILQSDAIIGELVMKELGRLQVEKNITDWAEVSKTGEGKDALANSYKKGFTDFFMEQWEGIRTSAKNRVSDTFDVFQPNNMETPSDWANQVINSTGPIIAPSIKDLIRYLEASQEVNKKEAPTTMREYLDLIIESTGYMGPYLKRDISLVEDVINEDYEHMVYTLGRSTAEGAEQLAFLALSKTITSIMSKGAGGSDGGEKLRIGSQVDPLEKTYDMALDPELHANLVAEKYGINLKSRGQEIKITYDPNLYSAGKVKAIDPNTIILGPSAYYSEIELANTIAHELNHSRAFINGIPALEPPAYNAGDSLADYINGGR